MKFENLLIAMVVVALCATGFGIVITDLSDSYDVPVSESITNAYGNLSLTEDIVKSATDDVKDASVYDTGSDFDIVTALKKSVTVLKAVFIEGIPRTFILITSLGDFLPIPPFIIKAAQAVILISAAFALVYLFLRYKNE